MCRRRKFNFDVVLRWDQPLACLKYSRKHRVGHLTIVDSQRRIHKTTVRSKGDLLAAFGAVSVEVAA